MPHKRAALFYCAAREYTHFFRNRFVIVHIMQRIGRHLRYTVAIVFLLPVSLKALLWSVAEPSRWEGARWSSAGILPEAASDPAPRVTVFSARTAGWRGIVAVHTWLVVKPENADRYTRYEVTGWGDPIRVNQLAPDALWTNHRPQIVGDVRGPAAAAAIPKLEAAIRAYPYAAYGSYRMWPGPNSNTFVATVLRAAPELDIAMPPEAIGKDFRADGSLAGLTESETGVEVSLYGLLGIKIGRIEGVEVNFLTLVAGLDGRRPALKIPAFGRVGLDPFGTPAAVAMTPDRSEAKDAR
jgi:hypothetical protein